LQGTGAAGYTLPFFSDSPSNQHWREINSFLWFYSLLDAKLSGVRALALVRSLQVGRRRFVAAVVLVETLQDVG
jgi:hypothetical protein